MQACHGQIGLAIERGLFAPTGRADADEAGFGANRPHGRSARRTLLAWYEAAPARKIFAPIRTIMDFGDSIRATLVIG
jgi:hypothetical protein